MFNLYLLDISNANNTNGVDRHISELIAGLKGRLSAECLYHIRFIVGGRQLLHHTEIFPDVTCITLPLPEQVGLIINKIYWTTRHNEMIYKLLKPLFKGKDHIILHIHTLNLIDLGLEIQRHTNARIVTHLHCISWKNLYRLYRQYYLKKEYGERFYTGQSEERAYRFSDRIIACTNCGAQFLQNITQVPKPKIAVVRNGLSDLSSPQKRCFKLQTPVRLLFVGTVTPGKGIFYILEAIRQVQRQGYAVELWIAGTGPDHCFDQLDRDYSDISIHILGSLPFDKLQKCYDSADIGIIGSVQEQHSYVAIEMARAGLPVITTAVDGLDEIFSDEIDSLKIPVIFHPLYGLSVNTVQMAEAIVKLISDEKKRKSLSIAIRKLYEEKFTLSHMIEQIIPIYESIS